MPIRHISLVAENSFHRTLQMRRRVKVSVQTNNAEQLPRVKSPPEGMRDTNSFADDAKKY